MSISSSEITPEAAFWNRRDFLKAAILAGTGLGTYGAYRAFSPRAKVQNPLPTLATVAETDFATPPLAPGEKASSFEDIAGYNNFYEFSTDKSAVARRASRFVTRPWTVEVGGLVQQPRTFALDDLLQLDQLERVYRFRCVEGWSMVIPWVGFPLRRLLAKVQPLGSARYVAFQSYFDPRQMPDATFAGIDFPYVEGLRLDEAMHPLTLLATGVYGKALPNQNGAPVRLVVPWKYGFKSIKSVVRITLTEQPPPTTWNLASPREYGFYSNVNPAVNHPRWSQATERRIGELWPRPTLAFNGYGDQVASLYRGMDLQREF